jgi:hypothetical protein
LRKIVGHQMNLVTPGIRPAGSATGDQKRIMTPARAIAAGADYLVVGRPIVEAADPRAAAEAIQAEIKQGCQRQRENTDGKGWIARVDVHNMDGYDMSRRTARIYKYGAKFLVRGGRFEARKALRGRAT